MANKKGTNHKGKKLTLKQELFCQFYTRHRAVYGNATKSYALAYGYDLENADRDDAQKDGTGRVVLRSSFDRMTSHCSTEANLLLTNPLVNARLQTLFAEMLDETIVDNKLSEIITHGKHADAIQAIREFNKLKKRVTDKIDVTSGGKVIAGFNFVRNGDAKIDNTNGGNDNADDSAGA